MIKPGSAVELVRSVDVSWGTVPAGQPLVVRGMVSGRHGLLVNLEDANGVLVLSSCPVERVREL